MYGNMYELYLLYVHASGPLLETVGPAGLPAPPSTHTTDIEIGPGHLAKLPDVIRALSKAFLPEASWAQMSALASIRSMAASVTPPPAARCSGRRPSLFSALTSAWRCSNNRTISGREYVLSLPLLAMCNGLQPAGRPPCVLARSR